MAVTKIELDERWGAVLDAWRKDTAWSSHFAERLADAPYEAFRWETPALTIETLDRPFECVLIDAPELQVRADPTAFEEHLVTADPIVTFANLRGDAQLVVPTPLGPEDEYAHFAAFLRSAPESQRQALWPAIAAAVHGRIDDRPVWLNTAGAGVPWLHVRLDDRPKYYRHRPYR